MRRFLAIVGVSIWAGLGLLAFFGQFMSNLSSREEGEGVIDAMLRAFDMAALASSPFTLMLIVYLFTITLLVDGKARLPWKRTTS
jgi:hypothetical protein